MASVKKHFDFIASNYDYYKKKNWYYYQKLKLLLTSLIPPKSRVLEVGCGTGELLTNLNPIFGIGIDISPEMIKIARRKFTNQKNLKFTTLPINELAKTKFDYIFMSDVIEHLDRPQKIFSQISKLMKKKTIFISTMANPKWEWILMIAEKFGLKMPEGDHNRWSYDQMKKMLTKVDLRIIKHDYTLLFPKYIPIITILANTFLEPIFKRYAFIEYVVAVKK